jgi:hypothetical protein
MAPQDTCLTISWPLEKKLTPSLGRDRNWKSPIARCPPRRVSLFQHAVMSSLFPSDFLFRKSICFSL